MNRVAFWVAHTTVGATVPTALAQATASPLPEIEAGARLDPDIAAKPLVALTAIPGCEGMFIRVLVLVAVVNRALLAPLLVPFLVMNSDALTYTDRDRSAAEEMRDTLITSTQLS